jgi:DNA repair photolyase
LKEVVVNRIAFTLWSAISFYEKKPLEKVPDNFKEICDKTIRKDVLAVRTKINNDKNAIAYLKKNLSNFLEKKDIKEIKKSIPNYYEQNRTKDLWINIGEYSDIAGIDHITNFLAEVMKWVQEDNGLKFSFRTKCAELENLFTFPANDRIKITMNLNTQTAIDKYELETSSLDDRVRSINRIIKAGGFVVQLAIEPIIKYKNYETEYSNLVERIINKIDMSKVRSIKFGTVRYKSGLITTIQKNIPGTDLFNKNQNLVEPVKGDKRWRYSEEERIKIYTSIINKFGKKYKSKLGLAAEDPSIWDAVGLNKEAIHDDIVYQYKK